LLVDPIVDRLGRRVVGEIPLRTINHAARCPHRSHALERALALITLSVYRLPNRPPTGSSQPSEDAA
jgi:hypothetical protein